MPGVLNELLTNTTSSSKNIALPASLFPVTSVGVPDIVIVFVGVNAVLSAWIAAAWSVQFPSDGLSISTNGKYVSTSSSYITRKNDVIDSGVPLLL